MELRFLWQVCCVLAILLVMATETESLKFTVDSKGFIDSLKRMERQLQSLADKTGRVSGELIGSFVAIEASAAKLGGAVKRATENVGGAASDFQKLAGGLRGVNRALEVDKVVHFGDAIEHINDALGKASNLRTFTNRMSTLSERLTTMRKEAVEAAKAIDRLAKAAQRELGAARDRKLSPAQARAQDARAATAELRQQRAEIQLRQQAAREAEESARRIARANQEVGRSARRASTQTVGAFKTIEGTVASLRIKLLNLRTAFAFLGGGFLVKRVLGFAGDFEQRLAEVGTIISDQSEVTLPQYREQLLSLAQKGPQDLIDLTESFYQVVSAGIPTVQGAGGAFDVLATAQRASVAGVSSLKQGTDALLTALNGFRRESLSATEASDKLFATVRLGRTRFDLLARSVGRVAAIADDFGVGSNELLGGLAAITRVVPSTNEAVTQLRALITGIVRPTERASRVLQILTSAKQREDLDDLLSAGGLQRRGLVKTLEELTVITGGSSAAISKLFPNVRALAASAILSGRNFEQYRKIVEGVADSTGETDRAFSKLEFTFNNVAAVFRNKVATILIRIGDRVMPKLVELFERLGTFLLKNQDKIIKFFETLADILINLIVFIQKNLNEVLGGGLGLLAAKVVSTISRALGDSAEEANEKGLEIGQNLRSGIVKALLAGGAVVGGAALGESIFGIKTDIEGSLALQQIQPVFNDEQARAAGFRTAEQYRAALDEALSGQTLLADSPTIVRSEAFQDVLQLRDIEKAVESAESLADVLGLIRKASLQTQDRLSTLGKQAAGGLEDAEKAYRRYAEAFAKGPAFSTEAKEALDAFQATLKGFREDLGDTADLLDANAPELAAALRSFGESAPTDNLTEFRNALNALRSDFPEFDTAILRAKERFVDFTELLDGADLTSLSPDITAEDPIFDDLWREYREQVKAAYGEQKQLSTDLESALAKEKKLRDELASLQEKAARSNAAAADAGLLVQLASIDNTEKFIAAKKREVQAAEDAVAAARALAKQQEQTTTNILDNILKTIDEVIRKAKEAQQQAETEDLLKGAGEAVAKQRLGEIKDNGLIQRIRRRIVDLEQERLEILLRIDRLTQKQAIDQAQYRLSIATTLGDLRKQEDAQEALYRAQQLSLLNEVDTFAERERALKARQEELKSARELEEVTRAVKNLDVDIARAKVDLANAKQKGEEPAIRAAQDLLAAYTEVRKIAGQLTPALVEGDKAAEKTLKDALDARLGVLTALFRQQADEARKEAIRQIELINVAAAARPNLVKQFEISVSRARAAATEAALGIENILQNVLDTNKQVAATQREIALSRQTRTLSGQLGQRFGGNLDLAQFRAARQALQEEIQQVTVGTLISIAQLRKRAAAEEATLLAQLAEARDRRNRISPVAQLFGLGNADELDLDIEQLNSRLQELRTETGATIKQKDAELSQKLAELGLAEEQLAAYQALTQAQSGVAEQTAGLVDTVTFGGATVARFGADIVDAFSGDAEAAVLGLTGVLTALSATLASITRKFAQFLPNFSQLIDDVFNSLLRGANSVIDGLSRAFTGVFDLLFGGFTNAIESILGFDFFGDQEQQANPTLPAVNLQGRFFDQRPEDRARVLDEIRAQGEARRQLEEQSRAGNAAQLSPQDLARQTLERAIEAAVRATEVIVEILPELLETFLERVIELLPTLAGRLAQAVAEGIRILADKFDEILVATLDAISEALPVILAAIGEAIPVIVAQLVAQLPRIVYETLKGLGYGAAGFVGGVFSGIASLFHSGGTVRHNQRNSGLAAAMHAMGAPAFSAGGMVTPGGLTSSLLNRRLQKDEVPAVLQVGERVVSREELARMGGEAALNRLIANGGLGGGESFDGVIQGMSPQAAAVFAAAIRQGMAGLFQNMNQQGYNPNLGARIGRGRGYL